METSCNQSTLETLPDEILLEICKYLLCTDILLSFNGLNYRLTRMITQYRHHISLYKTSMSNSDYLFVNILPEIGSQIHSLFIDSCFSLLQEDLFIKYFGKKMSIVFPNLERISLFSYQYDQLSAILASLNDLHHLVEIRLYSLFPIHVDNQSMLARSLFQANNNRLTTMLIDDQSSPLHVHETDCYLNVIRLSIKLRNICDLPSLFRAVPNVEDLDVIIDENGVLLEYFRPLNLSPLLLLTHFQLLCTKRSWMLEELLSLFLYLPIVQHLSLCLLINDSRLIEGDTILPSLPSTVKRFDYAVYYFSLTLFGQIDKVTSSWPPSHPVTCLCQNSFLFLHTLPWHMARISIPSFICKTMSCNVNKLNNYDSSVEQLGFTIDKSFTLIKSFGIIAQCRYVREINISVKDTGNPVKEEQTSMPHIPKLSRLVQVAFYGSIPSGPDNFSFILNAAPNLFRLDLSFEYLWQLLENQQICHLLGQRITSLSIIANATNSASMTLNEDHVPIIASKFFRLRDLYVSLTHISPSTTIVSNDNILEDSTIRSVSVKSGQEQHKIVSPYSSESMVVCLLREFKEHRLIGLCIDGEFVDELKTDVKQWLQQNTVLCEQQFEALFSDELHRLLIWM